RSPTLPARDFLQHAEALEVSYELVCRGWGEPRNLADSRCIDDRVPVERLEDLVRLWGSTSERLDLSLDSFLKLEDIVEGRDAASSRFDEAHEKELEPLVHVVLLAHPHQVVVVKRAVALEEIGEVQHGLLEDALAHEIEGDHEPPDTSIAIQE